MLYGQLGKGKVHAHLVYVRKRDNQVHTAGISTTIIYINTYTLLASLGIAYPSRIIGESSALKYQSEQGGACNNECYKNNAHTSTHLHSYTCTQAHMYAQTHTQAHMYAQTHTQAHQHTLMFQR